MSTFTTKDSTNTDKEFDFDGDGTASTPFVARSRTLLGATSEAIAASPSAVSGLNGLLKGLWDSFNKSLFVETAPGTVSIGTALTVAITIDTKGFNFLAIELVNGSTALVECIIEARYHSGSGAWNPKTFGAAEYTTGTGKQSGNSLISIIEASGNLNALAAAATGWVEINCSRYESVRVRTRVASGTSSVIPRAIAKKS